MLALDERQHPTEPRIGGLWFSLNFDGRLNPPDLTEQEKEYIRAVLNEALAALPGHDCEEGLVCEEHPATGWPHEDCGGAGMPCSVPDHSGMRPT